MSFFLFGFRLNNLGNKGGNSIGYLLCFSLSLLLGSTGFLLFCLFLGSDSLLNFSNDVGNRIDNGFAAVNAVGRLLYANKT